MTQYSIGHEFPNTKEGEIAAYKAFLDGAICKNNAGSIRRWKGGCTEIFEGCWYGSSDSPALCEGPWIVVEDPSKPVPNPYSEMTPEEQKARLEEVLCWRKVVIRDSFIHDEVLIEGIGWLLLDVVKIKTALELGFEVTKGDE